MVCICVEISPELHQEESVLRSLVVQILQSFTLLRELVLDLPHVHRLNRRQLRRSLWWQVSGIFTSSKESV